MERGTKIRFTVNKLGTYALRSDVTFGKGDEGDYVNRHPEIKDWHIVRAERDGFSYEVPVHESHFEVKSI